jgi:hypothetical protein
VTSGENIAVSPMIAITTENAVIDIDHAERTAMVVCRSQHEHHARRDCDDVCYEDRQVNDQALIDGSVAVGHYVHYCPDELFLE